MRREQVTFNRLNFMPTCLEFKYQARRNGDIMSSKNITLLTIVLLFLTLAVPSNVTIAAGESLPFAGAPACQDNSHDGHVDVTDNPGFGTAPDNTLWHDLWNEVDGCHYDHEHGDNPALADAVFGKLGEEWGGNGIDHPFHTANEHNAIKHRSHKVTVRVNIPCQSVNGSDLCVTDVRILNHLDFFNMSTRLHSFWMEIRVCKVSNPSDCGTFGRGGHMDFGPLINQVNNSQVPIPADNSPFPLPNCGSTNRRLHRTDNQFATWYGFFYGAANPDCIPASFWAGGTPLGWLQVGTLVDQTWAKLDLNNPTNPTIICPDGSCRSNESLREQGHLISGSLNSALAINGKINMSGFTNLYGFIDPSCAVVSMACGPFYAVNVPVGNFQYRDDAFGLGKKQYDILFNGQSSGWLQFPGNAQDPTPTTTPPPSPSGPFVSTEVNPTSLNIGGTTLVSVNLNNVPVDGFKSAEFTCSYDADLVERSNIVATDLFGTEPVVAIHDPQNGRFIVAIAGTNSNKTTTSGPAFTFSLKGLQVGLSQIQCSARVSKGDNVPVDLTSTGANLTVGVEPSPTPFESPTPTPSPDGSLAGQVFASKPVTVSLLDASNVAVTSVVANPDGTFNLTTVAGNYTVVAMASGFLGHQGSVSITAGNTIDFPSISLLAGDVDGNNVIDQLDALTIGMSYTASTPAAADLNNDGVIDFLDLELLAENYRMAGPSTWE
jgi:hypothetical protein